MKEPNKMKLKELEAWFDYVARGALKSKKENLPHIIENRAWFCGVEFEESDFINIADVFEENLSNAGFAVLGREAEKHAETISTLHDRGFEIIFHGHRHHKFDNLSYDEAYDYISTGLDVLYDTTGIVPDGMFIPMSDASQGALDAMAELNFEWVVGKTDANLTQSHPKLITPESPYDDLLFEKGYSPEEVFKHYPSDPCSVTTYVIHPPYQIHYDAIGALKDWIATVGPISVSEQLDRGEGTSVILDCYNPFVVE